MANTIVVKSYSDNREEAVAAEAGIYPGMLLSRNSSAEFKMNDGVSAVCEKLFAIENDEKGDIITTVYADDDRVFATHAYPGDELNVLFTAAENIAIGDKLESAGDGTLKEGTTAPIAIAKEAIASAIAGTHYLVSII